MDAAINDLKLLNAKNIHFVVVAGNGDPFGFKKSCL